MHRTLARDLLRRLHRPPHRNAVVTDPETALVVGFGVTGQAVTRHLQGRGWTVVVTDDRPSPKVEAAAETVGVDLIRAPDAGQIDELVSRSHIVVPGPGVPPRHPVYKAAKRRGVPLVSEIELAASQLQVPLIAVTGTNGKTTVTTLIAAMLAAAGRRVVAAGNIGVPLVDVVDQDVD